MIELSPIRVQLKLQSPDGKYCRTDCANTKVPVQDHPVWLAKVDYKRAQEMGNPELDAEHNNDPITRPPHRKVRPVQTAAFRCALKNEHRA